jgi:hypothetical protein
MELTSANSGNPATLIYPSFAGNVARFLSGINNIKKKLGNVSSLKFKSNNGVHILLYTNDKINCGETLTYNYNAGQTKYKIDTSHYS